MNDKDYLELLMYHVEQMRQHQRDFFARKMPGDIKLSKQREKDVDDMIKNLRRRGYDTSNFKTNPDQSKMF